MEGPTDRQTDRQSLDWGQHPNLRDAADTADGTAERHPQKPTLRNLQASQAPPARASVGGEREPRCPAWGSLEKGYSSQGTHAAGR